MRLYLDAIVLIMAFGLLAGCGVATGVLRSEITRYSNFPEDGLNGSFNITPLEHQNGSVEFGRCAKYVERRLIEEGFRQAIETSDADYLVIIDYGVSGSRQDITTSQTNGKTDLQSETVYDRFFNLKMFDLKQSTTEKLVGVYEGTVKSTGETQNFSTVSFCMIDALFRDFFTEGTDRSDFRFVNKISDIVTGDSTKCVQ